MRRDLYSGFLDTRNFLSLDGLRFLSITPVIFHHAVSAESKSIRILELGFLGVDLFFVISGFLIVTLLLREKDKTNDISLRKFYMRRTLRIFPLYYGVVAAYFILYKFILTDSIFGGQFLSEIWIYLTYTANFFPVAFAIVWSLAAEEQFYMFWPTVEKYFKHSVMLLLIVLICINQLINFPSGKIWLSNILGREFFDLSIAQATFTPILLGVLVAHLLNQKGSFQVLSVLTAHKIMPWFYLILLAILCQFSPPDISGLSRLSIQICMAFLLTSCVIRQDHHLNSVLTLQPVKRVGAISYGIYLLHIISIVIVTKILDRLGMNSDFFVFIFGALLSIMLAEISFRFYERPFLQLKKKFSVAKQEHI